MSPKSLAARPGAWLLWDAHLGVRDIRGNDRLKMIKRSRREPNMGACVSTGIQDHTNMASGPPAASLYDLSVQLYLPQTLFEEQADQNKWVLFAPDFAGLPVLIDRPTRELLHAFAEGARVTDVI